MVNKTNSKYLVYIYIKLLYICVCVCLRACDLLYIQIYTIYCMYIYIYIYPVQRQLCRRCIGGKMSGRTWKGIVSHQGRARSLAQNAHFVQFNSETPHLVHVLTPDYCIVASSDSMIITTNFHTGTTGRSDPERLNLANRKFHQQPSMKSWKQTLHCQTLSPLHATP